MCPQCKRDFLLETALGLECDRCYYRNTLERHQLYVDKRKQRTERLEPRAATASEAEQCFQQETYRRSHGGSDDGLATVGLDWMQRQQARENPKLSSKEEAKLRRRVQRISGHEPVPGHIVHAAVAFIAKKLKTS